MLIFLTGLKTTQAAAYEYRGDASSAISGAVMGFISFGLAYALEYKIVAYFVRKLCPNLIDNKKISKEEKLRIVNNLITETKQTMAKLTDNKDKEHCQNALNQLYSALNKINQQI